MIRTVAETKKEMARLDSDRLKVIASLRLVTEVERMLPERVSSEVRDGLQFCLDNLARELRWIEQEKDALGVVYRRMT